MPSKGRVREAYEAIAESYAVARRDPWPEVLAFADRLPRASTIVDLGCGHGRHIGPLAARGHRVLGLDFSPSLLALGRRAASPQPWADRVRWVLGEATRLPFRDRVARACLCIAVLHHLPSGEDRLRCLAEARRVLRPGGRVLVSVWALDQPRFEGLLRERQSVPVESRGDVEIPWPLPDGTSVPRYYHLFQAGELERMIIESGLRGETFFESSGNYFAEASRLG